MAFGDELDRPNSMPRSSPTTTGSGSALARAHGRSPAWSSFAAVVFVLQNLDSVPVNFLSFSFDAPLIVLLAIAAGAGIVGRWLVRFWLARRRK